VPSSKSVPKQNHKYIVLEFEAIGTQWSIELRDNSPAIEDLTKAITSRIHEFDRRYSRFRKDSLVVQMSERADTYKLPSDARLMMDLYHELYEITEGKMTPLIGQTLVDAGYDSDYSLAPKELRKPLPWDDVLSYDFPKLILKQPALLDFGAIGKGYLVDIINDILIAEGMQEFLINAGGDILQHDKSEVAEIGLEHPGDTTQAIGIAHIQNQSLCGSAGNRRTWRQYNHIINPETLSSPEDIRAIWVCADTTMLADALTTALFFVDPKHLLKHYAFSYAIVYKDYALQASKDFPAQFFTSKDI
jgi:thiamine biosynthesis lipoprotein